MVTRPTPQMTCCWRYLPPPQQALENFPAQSFSATIYVEKLFEGDFLPNFRGLETII